MKISAVLGLAACAALVAFLAGQQTQKATAPEASGTPASSESRGASRVHTSREATAAEAVRAIGKYASCSKEFSASNAARLSSEERLELFTNGALVGDYGNQEAMLCGLISVLSRDELESAMGILARVRSQGNAQAPEVWKSLWQQWGKLDPQGGLEHLKEERGSRTTVDARNMMTGWLDTDAAAALVWAQQPGKGSLEAAAAALAISKSANGNLKQLESAIQKFPEDDATAKACIDDYFDQASLSKEGQSAAAIYDQISPALRPAAWSAAAKRIGYENSADAKAWVTQHANDQGRNYRELRDLFRTLSYEDPEGTVRWAAQLPYAESAELDASQNPAVLAVTSWLQQDPAAATAWLKAQPQDAPWSMKIDNR